MTPLFHLSRLPKATEVVLTAGDYNHALHGAVLAGVLIVHDALDKLEPPPSGGPMPIEDWHLAQARADGFRQCRDTIIGVLEDLIAGGARDPVPPPQPLHRN